MYPNRSTAPVGKPGPSLVTSLVVIGAGLVVIVPAIVFIVIRASSTIRAKATSTPGVVQRDLGSGTWYIYQLTGSEPTIGSFTYHNGDPTIQPSDVEVTSPAGEQLPVSYVTDIETITQNGRIYTGALEFDAPAAGRYQLRFSTPSSSVLVARSLGDTFKGVLGFLGAAGVGGLVVAVGLVLLVVGIVRRSKATALAPAPVPAWTGTPPGWYPDPTSGGRTRWWDGWRWTDRYL